MSYLCKIFSTQFLPSLHEIIFPYKCQRVSCKLCVVVLHFSKIRFTEWNKLDSDIKNIDFHAMF